MQRPESSVGLLLWHRVLSSQKPDRCNSLLYSLSYVGRICCFPRFKRSEYTPNDLCRIIFPMKKCAKKNILPWLSIMWRVAYFLKPWMKLKALSCHAACLGKLPRPARGQRGAKSHISGSHGQPFPTSFSRKLRHWGGSYITLWPGHWFMSSAPPERPHGLPQYVKFTMQNHVPFRDWGWRVKKEALNNGSESQLWKGNCVFFFN